MTQDWGSSLTDQQTSTLKGKETGPAGCTGADSLVPLQRKGGAAPGQEGFAIEAENPRKIWAFQVPW